MPFSRFLVLNKLVFFWGNWILSVDYETELVEKRDGFIRAGLKNKIDGLGHLMREEMLSEVFAYGEVNRTLRFSDCCDGEVDWI